MLITVFTPLYNRAKFLKEIYNSLILQKDINIEWIIVDDGSVDNAEAYVSEMKSISNFDIAYHKQQNKGKHFAINKGLQLARGELFLILDSDDQLPKEALNTIRFYYKKIKNNPKIAGVAGRRNYSNGKIVGNQPFDEVISNSLDIRHVYKTNGDLVEVYETEILRKEGFPEIENEKFCPEALVWNRIAQNYNLLFFNKGIYTTQYLDGGLTDKIVKIRMTSPISSMLTYSELASYSIPFIQKIKAYINFWRFSFNSKQKFNIKLNYLKYNLAILFLPLGFILYINDRRNNK